MANLIQVARYGKSIARKLAMKQDSPQPFLAAEIEAAFDLSRPAPEDVMLMDEKLGMGGVSQNGAAGTFNYVALFNPVSSGQIIVVESVAFGNGTAGGSAGLAYCTGPFGADLDLTLPKNRDGRQADPAVANPGRLTAQIFTGTSRVVWTSIGIFIHRRTFPNAAEAVYDQPIILAAGVGLMVTTVAVTQAVSAWFSWRERILENTELVP